MAVIAVSIAVQIPLAWLLVRAPVGSDTLVQGAVGAVILWIAIGLRTEHIGRQARLWLSALGLIAFWGTIVAVILTAVLESRRARAPQRPG